ncbi:MAG: thymidylate kinase [Fimbriimonadales bacterium]|nr:MAG: thymidylate kinase [Fimbriimonadales bacterium]
MPRAPFITFEGVEGAGKTTLARRLVEWLSGQGVPVLLTREPGGSELGKHLRPLILHQPLDAYAELFLLLADRRQHTLQVIEPALQQGTWVVSDRYADSTLVYQGYGRGLSLELVRQLNAIATNGLQPDLTVLIDLPVEDALARANDPNRFEAETIEFHQRIRTGYLQEAAIAPERYAILDGQATPETILERLQAIIRERFP